MPPATSPLEDPPAVNAADLERRTTAGVEVDTWPMGRVDFRLQAENLGVGRVRTVTPYIDGVSLVELARRVELGPAAESGESDLAGRYAGLVIDGDPWQEWYTGEHPQVWFGDGDSCVLGCTCGDTGCWPLTARITIRGRHVLWSDFRTGHRPWDLADLGPFRFNRPAYDRALYGHARS
jgi:hypothetical protein